MKTSELLQLRDKLFSDRKEILERNAYADASVMRTLSEPEIEIEEGVQKKVIGAFYGQLGAEGRSRIGTIDLALKKMATGEYGVCESCEDDIPLKRLQVVPWARLCIDCARDHEKKGELLPESTKLIPSAKLPDEYARLTKEEFLKLIQDRIDAHLDYDFDSLSIQISIRKGIVYLEGSVPIESDREIILQVLTEEMRIDAVLDLMQVDESSEMEYAIDYSSDSSEEPIAEYMM